MSRQWNGKAFIDRALSELWSTSSDTTFLANVVRWANEIQDDISSELPIDFFKFKLKKLLPTEQEFIDLGVQIPIASTVAMAAGGSLVEDTAYKVYVTFVVYDPDKKHYIESEASPASSVVTGTAVNKTISVSAIDLFDGTATKDPVDIYRRIYLAKKASADSAYGEPFYVGDIEDNTTLIYSITSEPTSTITPPSDSQIDQISSDFMYFDGSTGPLQKVDSNKLRSYSPSSSNSTTPDNFDYFGTQGIHLYPELSSTATDAQRTLFYTVYRRPAEIFYDVDRAIDLPIVYKSALLAGIIWKGYEFRDRDGAQSKANNYEVLKKKAQIKLKRQRGRPGAVRDVNGDTFGYEV